MPERPAHAAPAWPFLAPVGGAEREPLRWLLWLSLTVVLALAGALASGFLFGLLDARVLETIAPGAPIPEGPRRPIAEAQFMFVVSTLLAVVAMGVLLAAKTAFRRPAWTFVAPAGAFRPRLLLAGFAVFGALVLVSIAIEPAVRGEPLDAPVLDAAYALDARLLYALAAVPFLLLAATAEEIVFRGVLLQLTGAFTRNLAILVVLNGLVFSALHFDPAPGAFVARAVSGAVWAWAVLRLSGLEFALGAHFANNLLLALLVEPISEGAQVGRDHPWPYVAADVGVTLGVVVCLQLALRSPAVRSWIGAAPAP